jgi:Holliday junction DNA helicase RuvA
VGVISPSIFLTRHVVPAAESGGILDCTLCLFMIAYLSGKLLIKQPNHLIVDVNGVGYEVTIPLSTFYETGEIGSSVQLQVYTHVREDTIALYGFKTVREKSLFEHLIMVSGIGPKLGITILSGMSSEELIPAIRDGNLAKLTSIPGVGKKTAERLVLELRDKLGRFETFFTTISPGSAPSSQAQDDVLSALVNLGYPKIMAEKALQRILASNNAEQGFESLLKGVLQHLSR